ncbi:glycosyltransferase family 2 protein [Pelagibacterium sp. H642]|uniref:glycosyltransferase family 2 protein n=1 Tax=Pelagibacterium sp. H642 TaxID=1881069 RepID=UPI0028168C63|nr:glycosyltransferase family 2 protein [Pelagibacterium sp. H642]WMT89357.1 glycosyltransferase [Pelagibacterium sp. H642]
MASYNSADYIGGAVKTVQEQYFKAWELLISDDASTDKSIEIVSRLKKDDTRIRVFAGEHNQGPAGARNLAIRAATGRYIAFLDSDDLWKPEKLETQIAFMQQHDLAFTFSSYDRIDEAGNFINTHYVEKPVAYHDLLKSCVIGCLTAVYDTEKLGKVYMPDIRKRQDFGLWLRILKKVDVAYPISESLARYRVRNGSISANKATAAKYTWSIYRDVEKLGLARSAYYFAHYAAQGVLNTYVKPRLER